MEHGDLFCRNGTWSGSEFLQVPRLMAHITARLSHGLWGKQTFLQARNDHVVTARGLMGFFHKIQLRALAKCLASA